MLTYAKIVGLRRKKRADTDGCRRAVTGKIYIAQSVYSGGVDFYAGVQPDGCRCHRQAILGAFVQDVENTSHSYYPV